MEEKEPDELDINKVERDIEEARKAAIDAGLVAGLVDLLLHLLEPFVRCHATRVPVGGGVRTAAPVRAPPGGAAPSTAGGP